MHNFSFQKETDSGWVFAKHVSGEAFLFGSTLEDVIQQVSAFEEFSEHVQATVSALPLVAHWSELEVA